MAAEAYPSTDAQIMERGRLTLGAAAEPGDVLQYYDGRACYVEAVDDLASGAVATVVVKATGISLPLATNVAAVRGMDAFWDESANTVVATPGLSVGDFWVGTFAEDKAGGTGVRAKVNLGIESCALWSLKGGASQGTGDTIQAVNGLGVTRLSGGSCRLEFDATSEQATASVMSGVAVPVADNWIISGVVNITTNGDDAAFDAVFGAANDDHASNPDTITESAFLSINGASTNINAESDDGTTEVAATDTTVDFTAGTPFSFWIDGRTIADIQIYVNGVNVLPSSTFRLDAATGPIRALALIEKSANDSTAVVDVLDLKLIRLDDAAA